MWHFWHCCDIADISNDFFLPASKIIVQFHGLWPIRYFNTPDHYCSLDFIDFPDCILFCQLLQLYHLQCLLLLLEMTIGVTSNTVMSASPSPFRMLMDSLFVIKDNLSLLKNGAKTFHRQLRLWKQINPITFKYFDKLLFKILFTFLVLLKSNEKRTCYSF